ncbi:MAG: sigma 54-interacting transcriptional regulator [Bacteroidetes bacterium]|nr:sigma 54-interacting transcriptional regulator [Bacteroidota bacterium]MBU1117025.1 sigma 54-interacting transcriptional regulator [Bacteroidota bacterium]MBU1797620.1 sigma 54-interacting transcriptional regulator [Bacteroidota bacterium]
MKKTDSIPIKDAETILDNVSDGVFTVNKNLIITYFNSAAEKISGVSRNDALGKFCFNILKSNICETNCPINTSLANSSDIINSHQIIYRVDEDKIPLTISVVSLKDSRGRTKGGVEIFRDLSKVEALEKEIKKQYTFEDIISKNHKVLQIFNILPIISESDSTILLEGASGTGKELFARAIHNLSHRKNEPFVAVNCAALPDTLLESELFGYIKGAFTDAKKNKPGRFELAKKGTIFLDEIDSMPLATQVKLLRVLQEKEFEPLGATQTVKTNVRVISATKNNLHKLVQDGQFRPDLFYRINVVKIELPSLKERRDDIPLLIQHFIKKFNHQMQKSIRNVSDEVLKILLNYSYEGNIRQLENIMEHSFVMCQTDTINWEHLPPEINFAQNQDSTIPKLDIPLKESERNKIIEVLNKNNWNTSDSADELQIHKSTLWRKMKKYRLLHK